MINLTNIVYTTGDAHRRGYGGWIAMFAGKCKMPRSMGHTYVPQPQVSPVWPSLLRFSCILYEFIASNSKKFIFVFGKRGPCTLGGSNTQNKSLYISSILHRILLGLELA